MTPTGLVVEARQSVMQRVFVTGDLNVDQVTSNIVLGETNLVTAVAPIVGGSAFNAAVAFKEAGFEPIVFGSVGSDRDGDLILASLRNKQVRSFIHRHPSKPTCICHLLYFRGNEAARTIFYAPENANDYDAERLEETMRGQEPTEQDLIFASLHVYDQTNRSLVMAQRFFRTLRSLGCRLIVDLVPHTIYHRLTIDELRSVVNGKTFIIIAELRTFMKLISPLEEVPEQPTGDHCDLISRAFPAEFYICRYGVGNISRQLVFSKRGDVIEVIEEIDTGYEQIEDSQKRGFGDLLTASTIKRIIPTLPT